MTYRVCMYKMDTPPVE